MKTQLSNIYQLSLVTALVAFGTSTASAQSFTFGSNNDGDGSPTFTQSTVNEVELDPILEPGVFTPEATWSTELDSVRIFNDGSINAGFLNLGFLGEFILDRSEGKSYTMNATFTITTMYADDNNRVGVYLFGDVADLSANTPSALGFIYNVDKSDVFIAQGIEVDIGSTTVGITGTTPFTAGQVVDENSVVDYQLDFAVTVDFAAGGLMNITATMTDPDGAETTTTYTASASAFTGDYFGFVSRSRVRGSEFRDDPVTLDFNSISITENIQVEEPPTELPGSGTTNFAIDTATDELSFELGFATADAAGQAFTTVDLTGASAALVNGNTQIQVTLPGFTQDEVYLKLEN